MNTNEDALAYILGELTPEERTAFERRMDGDPVLRQEVEEWRAVRQAGVDWARSEPLGMEGIGWENLRRSIVEDYPSHPLSAPRQWMHRLVARLRPGMRLRSGFAWALTVTLIVFAIYIFWRGSQEKPSISNYVQEERSEKTRGSINFPPNLAPVERK